jgi:hypothetical protein
MPPTLKEVLDESAKIINFIKSRPKNTRLFKMLCEDVRSLRTPLLLHAVVRWLSLGKTLTLLLEMKSEVRIFLIDDELVLGNSLCDNIFNKLLLHLKLQRNICKIYFITLIVLKVSLSSVKYESSHD